MDKLKFSCFGRPPRRIFKAIRRLDPKRQSSIQFGTTTLFQNLLPSTEIEKSSALNSQPVAPLERFSEINIKNYKPKVNLNENVSNILYIENFLISNFFHANSNIFEWNSSSKNLKNVIEIHKGKRFVRMEYVTECNLDISEQYLSKASMDDVGFENSKKNLISEYDNQTRASNSSCNFLCQDKFHIRAKDLVSPNSIISSQSESNLQLPSSQSTNVLLKFISNAKVEPTKMYQICLVLKDESISYIWESASEEFKHYTEFVFDVEHGSISYPVTDEKVEVYYKSNVKEGNGTNFNKKTLQTETEVPDLLEDVCEMMPSIYDEIQKCKEILDTLKETTELIKKEFSFPLLCLNARITDCLSMPEPHLEVDFKQRDFSDCYVKSFEEKGSIPLDTSLGIQYSKREMNELAKSLGTQRSAFIEAECYESLKHLNAMAKATNSLLPSSALFENNSQDNSVDVHCKLSTFRNESEEDTLMLPSTSSLLLLDSILFNLQVTYDIVENEVHSWLLHSETDQSDFQIQNFWNETSCPSVRTLADQHECFTNNNYLMRFKGRNTDTTIGKYYDWFSSSSDSDAVSLPGDYVPESDLDDSESSLEGSFRQHTKDSRASTISSDDDFDDIPRFSLPSRTSNDPKFYTKKTELCNEVSCREWSWKNAETEISLKCTHKGRRFRSEEHCKQGGLGIPKDFLQEDLGIPEDLLRDFNRVTSLSENATNVEHEADVDNYSR